jgi:hypothetical protein
LNREEVEHRKRLRDACILRTVHQLLHTEKEMYSLAVVQALPGDTVTDLEHMKQRKTG